MNNWADSITSELTKRQRLVFPVVEIYKRTQSDIVSISAPGDAIGRFSNVCFDWVNSTGVYHYDAKVLAFPEVATYLGDQINTAEIKFGNATRGVGSMSRFILDNKIKGCWMVIRLVFPDSPEDSVIVFWGKCERPGEVNNTTLSITASQDIGDSSHELPFRSYQANCPLDFARPGGGCLGDQTLDQKSVSYREAFAQFSTSGCNKLFSTCVFLDNTRYFQGQRVVAVSGQFSYITVEEVVKRVLFWTKRKKIQTVKTDNWSSVNQSESNETIPLAFGRCQLQGHPITWADVGEQVRSILGFAEGKISAFNFVRSRTEGIHVISQTEHLGDWGGVGTQTLDTLFNGVSGYNSKLAYLEVLTDGSSPTQVDDAPIITAVLRGLEVPLPDAEGNYTAFGWTNNPVNYTRFLLTDSRFGKIPLARMDDDESVLTSYECDLLVEDRTNDEAVILPSNEAANYGIGFRRFRSAGRYTSYKDMYLRDQIAPDVSGGGIVPPEFDDPEIQWYNPFEPYTVPKPQVILRQKYTFNGALQEKTSLLDFLTKRVLPTFKGYINYGFNGKIQIKTRKKADNGYVRMLTSYLDTKIPISNIKPWLGDYSGYLLIGVSLETAEIRQVVGIEYSTACNGTEVVGEQLGDITIDTGNILQGSTTSPAKGFIKLGGTVSAGSEVNVIIDSGDSQFNISYVADGIEDIPTCARMLMAFLNAHPQFNSYLTAYILPADFTKIWIRCEVGYLNLSEPLEYAHAEAEEVLRVQAVFENCGELTANTSAQFDNIIADSFTWNTNTQEDINAVISTYTSAVDDFHLTKISPRAAWDTIDLEGSLVKKDLDLTFVDNYWQAAYLTKGDAIENIDGNLFFNWSTDLSALRLELGDVVAVRHDSGDGALNYVPVWMNSIKTDLDKFIVKLEAKLYLSAAHDLHVQPIDALLTTTLNAALNPDISPTTVGTGGGTSQSSEPNVTRPDTSSYYATFGTSRYSVDGKDIT